MIVEVIMLAFEPTEKRRVVEFIATPGLKVNEYLECVFHNGQNDFQPRQCCSVSTGDVIIDNEFSADPNKPDYYLVKGCGFEKITEEQLVKWRGVKRIMRSLLAMGSSVINWEEL